jgi:hypothetical protein
MKADDVGAQKTVNQLLGVRLDLVDLDVREGNVQEEANPGARYLLPDQLRDEGEMIVLHPDEVAFTVLVHNRLGEPAVDLLVGAPLLVVELAVFLEVMKKRPQALVRVAEVVLLDLLRRQRHGLEPVALGRILHAQIGTTQIPVRARPAYPESSLEAQDRIEGRHEPSFASLHVDLSPHLLQLVRQAVAHHDETLRKQIVVYERSGAGHAVEPSFA